MYSRINFLQKGFLYNYYDYLGVYGVSEILDKYEGGGYDYFSGRVNSFVKCYFFCYRYCNYIYKLKIIG